MAGGWGWQWADLASVFIPINLIAIDDFVSAETGGCSILFSILQWNL